MSAVTQQLIHDHAHMLRVLACIDHCARRYFSEDREEQDLEILLLSLEYMNNYADQFHHPLEEKAMSMIKPGGAMPAEDISRLNQQHTEITAMTDELLAMFEAIANDQVIPYDRINQRLDEYIQLQYAHLKFENEHFIPVIDSSPSAAQMEPLLEILNQSEDPMFTEHREEFEDLYHYLIKCEKADLLPKPAIL